MGAFFYFLFIGERKKEYTNLQKASLTSLSPCLQPKTRAKRLAGHPPSFRLLVRQPQFRLPAGATGRVIGSPGNSHLVSAARRLPQPFRHRPPAFPNPNLPATEFQP